MKKLFIVTPTIEMTYYTFPWFTFGKNIEEVEARFPGCAVEEDV